MKGLEVPRTPEGTGSRVSGKKLGVKPVAGVVNLVCQPLRFGCMQWLIIPSRTINGASLYMYMYEGKVTVSRLFLRPNRSSISCDQTAKIIILVFA
jgi:hypothetical protein